MSEMEQLATAPDASMRNNQEQALNRLKELGIDAVEYALALAQEREKLNAEVFWVRFSPPKDQPDMPTVEAKIYLPKEKKNNELVMFIPGYPGGKAGRWEKMYGESLLKEGYAFVSLRHNSTALAEQKEEDNVYNCPERLADGRRAGQKYLGAEKKEGYVLSDIIDEPVAAIRAMAPAMKKIKLIGHSFGTGCVWNAVDRLNAFPEISRKITHMISLAGFLSGGKEDEKGFWQGLNMSLETLVDLEMEDEKEDGVHASPDREKVKQGIMNLAKRMGELKIPEHITQILVSSPEDKYIALPSKMRVAKENGKEVLSFDYPGYTERSIVIEDQTQEKKHHSLLALLPENLIRGLKFGAHHGKWPKFVVVREKLSIRERKKK